jgi:hypothetical protein
LDAIVEREASEWTTQRKDDQKDKRYDWPHRIRSGGVRDGCLLLNCELREVTPAQRACESQRYKDYDERRGDHGLLYL